MKLLIGAVLLLLTFPTYAEPRVVAKGPNLVITLDTDLCEAPEVLARIKEEHHGNFRKADVLFQGKPLKACWTIDTALPGMVILVDETGDSGQLPMAAFKPVGPGI